MQDLALDFQDQVAPQLQKYLILKSWWATNYVSLLAGPAAPPSDCPNTWPGTCLAPCYPLGVLSQVPGVG